jgi:hypothetical protein
LTLGPQRPRDTHTLTCPCGHGDIPAEQAGQRRLLEHTAAGDRDAFARLYDTQVEGVYRYLLAWTGDPGEAADLTAEVFHSAMGWLPTTSGPEGEAGAWLTAMSRDALAQRPIGSRGGRRRAAEDAVGAVARLREPEREVAVLRLLLGHSLDHTAHLSGYSRRAAMELQLAACLAIHDLTGGKPRGGAATPTAARPVASAEDFERRLGLGDADRTHGGPDPALLPPLDPALTAALTAAGALRRAAPGLVASPPTEFVRRLRSELVTGIRPGSAGSATASPPLGSGGASRGAREIGAWLDRRPWVATGVAAAGIVLVLALQAFGGPGARTACAGPGCPATTTRVVAAGGGTSVGTPLTTVVEPSTTSSTVAGEAVAPPQTGVPRTSASTVPPSTRPATTAPPTTAAPRPTTTTVPATTAPPTTAAPTTTTVAPAPT